MTTAIAEAPAAEQKFVRGLGLLDSTMLVAGSMIGSGIFIVSADIARLVGSAGWLLVVWAVTGVLTMVAALSYGELAAMMPRAGGQYVYLRCFTDAVDRSTDHALAALRDQPFDAAARRDLNHHSLDDRKHARPFVRQTYPERFHVGENALALRVGRAWDFRRAQC